MTLLEYWRLKRLLKLTDKALSKMMETHTMCFGDDRLAIDQWMADLNEVRSSIFESRSRDAR